MRLDLNFPPFQRELFSLGKAELSLFIRAAKKISNMDLQQVQQSSGLNLEKIKNINSPAGKVLYSIRMNRSFRAVVTIEGEFIRFVSLHPDHDSAYQ